MSDFNSTYNDIQKQISFANLTDQQIQELITALQIKRSAQIQTDKGRKGILSMLQRTEKLCPKPRLEYCCLPYLWFCQGYQERNKKWQTEIFLQGLQ